MSGRTGGTANGAPALAAVLFDLDDTLHDRGACYPAFVAHQHERLLAGRCDRDVYVRRFVELDRNGHHSKTLLYPELVGDMGIEDIDPAVLTADYGANYFRFARPMAGAEDMLVKLRARGLRLGIVTNGWTDFQKRSLDAIGLRDHVDAVIISDEVQVRKPDPRIFRIAAERLDVTPAHCLFVGDNPEADIMAAHALGMRTAWFKRSFAWPAGAPAVGPQIDALAELIPLLDGRAG